MIIAKAARICGWIATAVIVILSLVPASLRPVTGAPHEVEHFLIFAITGLFFGIGYRPRPRSAIGLVLFAGAIELVQLIVPGRHARLSDFIVDALAALFGLMAAAFARPEAAKGG